MNTFSLTRTSISPTTSRFCTRGDATPGSIHIASGEKNNTTFIFPPTTHNPQPRSSTLKSKSCEPALGATGEAATHTSPPLAASRSESE